MKDWATYSQTKTTSSNLSGNKPSVLEYTWIKIVDNSLIVFVAAITIVFSAMGAAFECWHVGSSTWFFDAAKICLGVLLGILTQRNRRR